MSADTIDRIENEISQALLFDARKYLLQSDIHASVIINHFHPNRGYKQTCDLKVVEEKDKRNVARCKCVNYCTWRNEIVLEKTVNSNNNFENNFFLN